MPQRTAISLALLIALSALTFSAASGALPAEHVLQPDRDLMPQGLAPDIARKSGKVWVWVQLKNQDLIGAAVNSEYAPFLRGTDPLSRKAAIMVENRSEAAAHERTRLSRQLEEIREDAMRALRNPAASAEAASIDVVARLRRRGVEVAEIALAPNGVRVRITAEQVLRVAGWREVASITPSSPVTLHNSSVVDGSPTWHANRYTGAGSADRGPDNVAGTFDDGVDGLDGAGGPDIGIQDVGVSKTHNAFQYDKDGNLKARVLQPTPPGVAGEHGMGVASVAAAYDPVDSSQPKGLAYGTDKIVDSDNAVCPSCFMTGTPYGAQGVPSDLPEIVNVSQGGANDEYGTGSQIADVTVGVFGLGRTGSAGNDNLLLTPLRVSEPGSAYNSLSVAAVNGNVSVDRSDDTIENYSSRGPTAGGRKKPDLAAYGGASCAAYNDDVAWQAGGCGDGTSFAAPRVAAGMILLEGIGVFNTSAQRAILINSAYPMDSTLDPDLSPETYWRPDTGWGQLALEEAYADRANFVLGSVSACCTNNARFFRQDGLVPGARTTLVWEKRLTAPYWPTLDQSVQYTLTDLDLFALTTTGVDNHQGPGGVDAAESSENQGPFQTANDNSDNVEQVRVSNGGATIIKVKASSAIDGVTAEDFALAGTEPIQPLETPIPTVTATRSLPLARTGQNITVTAHVNNPSANLELNTASATLNVPGGVTITSGPATQAMGTVGVNATASPAWTVQGTTDGLKQLTVDFSGVTYGETFSGNAATSFTIDGTGPQVSIAAPGPQVGGGDITVNWAGADTNEIAGFDVEYQVNGGDWQPWIANSTATSGGFLGVHGATYRFRVRATDGLGNTSPYTESTSVLVLSVLPAIEFEAPDELQTGRTDEIKLEYSNAVAPFSVAYSKNSTTPVTIADSKFVVRGPAADTVDHYEISLTDALGRTVSEEFNVRGILLDPSLRFSKPKYARGRLTIAGAFPSDADGRTTIQVRGKVKKKSFSVTKKLKVTRGKFKARLKVRRAALYTVTVRFAGDPRDGYDKTLDVKKFRVRR